MRQYERSGVTLDQCTECRGIFLDRGELEHLIDADAQFNAAAAPPPPPPPPAADPRYQDRRYEDRRYEDRRYGGDRRYSGDRDYYKRKKKKSFFSELFDD